MKTGPSFPRTRYDGQGAYASDSGRIPLLAWLGAVAVVAVLFVVALMGAATGF